jgi:hypothetical protein
MDFFSVPTLRFSVLYDLFVIRHDRRQIFHFNVTRHPTSLWVVQQLREAFPFESTPRFLIFDRDGKYGVESRFRRPSVLFGFAQSEPRSKALGRTA